MSGITIERDITPPIVTPLTTIWRYTRPELLYLAWATMEIALLTPILLSLMPWAHFWPPLQFALWLLLLMLLPFNLARVLTFLRIPLRKQQNIFFITFWIIVTITIRTLAHNPTGLFDLAWLTEIYINLTTTKNPLIIRDISLFFLIVLIWWRGITLSHRHVDIDKIGLHVRVSALLITPFAAWLSNLSLPFNPAPFFIAFFVGALMAIAITRAEEIEKYRSGENYPMTPRWLAIILGTSLAIGFVAWIIAALISGQSIPVIVLWLAPLWKAITFAATIILSTAVYVALPFLRLLERAILFFRNLPVNLPEPIEQAPSAPDDPQAELIEGINAVYNAIFEWIIPIVIIILFLITVLWLLVALSRYFGWRKLGSSEEVKVANPGRDDTAQPFTPMQNLLDRLGLMRRWHAASIRRLYRQMTRAATANGYPRGQTQTPYEYLKTLNQAWPTGQAQIQLITRAYVRVRYGEVPETPAELEEIRTAWHTLEQMTPPEQA